MKVKGLSRLITAALLLVAAFASAQNLPAQEQTQAAQAETAETAETPAQQQQEPEQTADATLARATDGAKRDLSMAADEVGKGNFAAVLPLIQKYVWPVVKALLILLIAYFLGKFLARISCEPVKRRVDETLGSFVSKLVFWAVMIAAILGVLGMFGISVATFAAVVAAAGFAVGLAFQGSLSNFAAGVLLLALRPFRVGDFVSAAGISAKVVEIDLFYTIFDTFDNRRIVVPNSEITSGVIENITFHDVRRVDVEVGVDYSADLQKTREILSQAAESLKEDWMVEGEGRGYQILLGDLGDSAVGWTVRFWTKTGDWLTVKEKLTEAVKNHLDAAGIGIPFPQMDVHIDRADSGQKSD